MSMWFVRKTSITERVNLEALDLTKVADASVKCILKSISSVGKQCYPRSFVESWIENKNTKNCMDWFLNPSNDTFLYVSQDDFDVKGVLLIQNQQNILLFYVHPDFIGVGVGGYLLESAIKNVSPKELHANATLNSVNWYLSKGFKLKGEINIEDNVLADIPVCLRKK